MITPQFWNLEISSQTSSFIAVISKTKQSGLKCCEMVPFSRLDFKAVLVGYNSTTTATYPVAPEKPRFEHGHPEKKNLFTLEAPISTTKFSTLIFIHS